MRLLLPVLALLLVGCSPFVSTKVEKQPGQWMGIHEAMAKLNFKTVIHFPCQDGKVKVVQKNVQLDGENYKYEAILVPMACEEVVSNRRLTKNGQPASRLEELRLHVDGQIPLFIGPYDWGRPVKAGSAFEFGYLGKSEKVYESDEMVILHISPSIEDASPYYSIERPLPSGKKSACTYPYTKD